MTGKGRAKKMKSANYLYIATITPLVSIPVYPPLSLEVFIGDGRGYYRLDAQPNSPHIFQTPLPVYHSNSDLPVKFCRGGEEKI